MRDRPAVPPPPAGSRYRRLYDHLLAVPPAQARLTLSRAQLEALLAWPLPATAGLRHWWTNRWRPHDTRNAPRAWQGAGWHVAEVTTTPLLVVLQRGSGPSRLPTHRAQPAPWTPAVPPGTTLPPRPGSKYRPLYAALAALPADQATVTLRFAEIEAVLGAPLPRGAWTRGWWTTQWLPGSFHQARAWLAAGWYVVRVDLSRTAVTFGRERPAAVRVER